MFNPLSPDLSEMSLDELTKRVSNLHKRLAHARQFQRQETITQTGIMLQEAEYELAKRSRDMYKQKNLVGQGKTTPPSPPVLSVFSDQCFGSVE